MLDANANYAYEGQLYALPMQTMGDRIRLLREARGLTQERLGEMLDVSKAAVSQWENGSTANIKLKTFMGLCSVLMTDPQYLIFGPGRSPLTPEPDVSKAKRRAD